MRPNFQNLKKQKITFRNFGTTFDIMTTQTTVPNTNFAIPKFAQDLIAGTIGGWAQVVVGKSRADYGVTALHLRFVTHQVTIRSSIRHYQSSYANTAFTTNLQECS